MKLRRTLIAGTALVALVLAGTAFTASAGSVKITTIGGQTVKNGQISKQLTGNVPVAGTAALAGQDAPQATPLVADAGDSPFAAADAAATLLGSGYGGAAPYTFAWSSPVGTLAGADAATAQLTGAPVGTHTVTLRVTDAKGATATDTVKVVIFQSEQRTFLDQTKVDGMPGATGTGAKIEFPFQVTSATSQIDVKISWGLPANDYDLRILDPKGVQRGGHGDAPPTTEENAGVSNPEPGTWTVVADKYATTTDSVRALVTGTTAAGGDPRPAVTSGGPYKFATGAAQSLKGAVTGGTAPMTLGWDLDNDGRYETSGTQVTPSLPDGHHIVSFKATDATGYERRQTTTVLVADPARLAAQTTPITVIGVADSGINPYHLEFSAQTYPDPEVLKVTGNFTKHPSEYIQGYPQNAEALNITLGKGYYPPEDAPIWTGNETIQPDKLYWFPGTKIIGAIDGGVLTASNTGDDTHPILDDNGHGSGSASVSTGNRYGYCPTCLVAVVEDLDETVLTAYNWVDITSHSFGYVGGAPLGPALGPNPATRSAAERGQTILFAAGNGIGNAFDVPIATYGSDQTGPDWTITVGAIRRDNQRAIIGDGIPVHISAWGDGNLPSACRTGTVGQCAFGGTSAATPYTAGVFGTVLTEAKKALGDGKAGQKPGQLAAEGVPVDRSASLADGKLTRTELREAVLKTAQPLNQNNEVSPFPYTGTAPYLGEANVLFEGYGAATPNSAKRAVDVLLGNAPMPVREFEDDFFELDRQLRDTIYGGYDRDGDGDVDSHALSGTGITAADVTTQAGTLAALNKIANLQALVPQQALGSSFKRYYLHRRLAAAPGTPATDCTAVNNEQYMTQSNETGDLEPCFENRVTSVAAAFRPVGIFASEDTLDAPLAAGSEVIVDLYMAGETPSVIRPTGVLMASDRELGEGAGQFQAVAGTGPNGAACSALGEACWTRYTFSFETTKHAFTGEQLTFQLQLVGARSWAFGFEGQHASRITILEGDLPAEGLSFGTSITEPANGSEVKQGDIVAGGRFDFPTLGSDEAGGHPTNQRVEVSVDNASFANPIKATLDAATKTWSAPLGNLSRGAHTIHVRAAIDQTYSAVSTSSFNVVPDAQVQWQIVSRNKPPSSTGWQNATGLEAWSFNFNTAGYEKGWNGVIVRLVQGGEETASTWAFARFR